MYWLSTRNAVVLSPQLRSLALLLRSPLPRHYSLSPFPLPLNGGPVEKICCYNDQKTLQRAARATKRLKHSDSSVTEKELSNILWWKERMQVCKKPSTVQLVQRLDYSNLLGLNNALKKGSLKEGMLNWEMLQFKSKFPREVLLCRVGEFYEAIGIDACILVEYAGLNPFGGVRSDTVPRAGCPVVT